MKLFDKYTFNEVIHRDEKTNTTSVVFAVAMLVATLAFTVYNLVRFFGSFFG